MSPTPQHRPNYYWQTTTTSSIPRMGNSSQIDYYTKLFGMPDELWRSKVLGDWYDDVLMKKPSDVEMAVNSLISQRRRHVFTQTEIGQIIQGLLRHAETMPPDPPRKDHDA